MKQKPSPNKPSIGGPITSSHRASGAAHGHAAGRIAAKGARRDALLLGSQGHLGWGLRVKGRQHNRGFTRKTLHTGGEAARCKYAVLALELLAMWLCFRLGLLRGLMLEPRQTTKGELLLLLVNGAWGAHLELGLCCCWPVVGRCV